MDLQVIIQALKATTVADDQENAAVFLKEASKMIGFSQILLNLTINEELEFIIRQAAVIYLKNLINKRWVVVENNGELPLSDQDKVPIRQKIISSVVSAPDVIGLHLCSIVQHILRVDFPTQWVGFTNELLSLLNSKNEFNERTNYQNIRAALLIIHKLCKLYEYKQQQEKVALSETMKIILPILLNICSFLVQENHQSLCELQKIILKIYFCLIQFSLDLNLITVDLYQEWLKVFLQIINKEIPADINNFNNSLEDSIYWKNKKWVMKIITRVFERYGSYGQVEKNYEDFAKSYCKDYLILVVNCIMKNILEKFVQKEFVSDRVLHLAISHLSDAIIHSKIWKIIKPYFKVILQSIIFPLFIHTKQDEDLWNNDVEEYLRMRYDTLEDLHNPSDAASDLLQAMVRRSGVLIQSLEFAFTNLSSHSTDYQNDGALHMLSVLAPTVMKNKKYKSEIEKLVHVHIVPRISHESRFVRARACYAAKCYSNATFATLKILSQLVHLLINCLRNPNEELPVKVEATTALSALLTDQETKVVKIVKPFVREILMEILHLVSCSQIEDLPHAINTIIDYFEEDVIPVAYDVATELVNIFNRLMGIQKTENSYAIGDDSTVTVMSVLDTIERILCLIENHKEILKRVEPHVRSVIITIFENFCESFFEEGLSLTCTLIETSISPEMWDIYALLHKCFLEQGLSFCDCMPVLHSFLTVDTKTFMADSNRARWLLEMCEKTLIDEDDCGDKSHIHAAKLLEIFVLQCINQIDNYLPAILQLALNRYNKSTHEDEELKPYLLLIFIAAFYYNNNMFIHILQQLLPSVSFEWFVNETMGVFFEGVHNKKMIIFLLCKLLTLPIQNMPTTILNNFNQIIELIIYHFENLQKCLKAIAENCSTDSESFEYSSDNEKNQMIDELKDSDDDIDEKTQEYLIRMNTKKDFDEKITSTFINDANEDDDIRGNTDYSVNDYNPYADESEVENYKTLLDDENNGLNVFVIFKEIFEDLEKTNPTLINSIINNLSEEKKKALYNLIVICKQKVNLENLKRVAQTGGYTFNANNAISSNFTFS